MSNETIQFVEVAVAALAGPATAMAGASRTGRVAAGDDRGEVGLWDASGERLATFRVSGPVCDVDVSPAGDRVAVRSSNGELTVVDVRSRDAYTSPVAGPGLVRLDPTGDGLVCVDPVLGRVETLNAWGKSIAKFAVPSPVCGFAIHPRDHGVLVATPRGVVARFTPWGEQVWAVDLAQYTGSLAVDERGTLLVVVGFGRGADGITPEDGKGCGSFDVARTIESAAVARRSVLLGTGDQRLVLCDRAGRVAAEIGVEAKPVALAVRDDARHAASRLDDGTVRLWHLTDVPTESRRARFVGGAPEGRFPPRESFRRALFAPGAVGRRPLVAVSSDGDCVAVADDARRALLLARDGSVLQEVRHEGRAMALEFVESGALLVTTRELRAVRRDGTRVLRSLPLDLWRATIAADRRTIATVDELGVLRLLDATTGRDRFTRELGATDAPTVLLVAAGRVAWQRRGGEIAVTDGDEIRRVAPATKGRARLVATTVDGPIVVAEDVFTAFGWDAAVRWSQKTPRPVECAEAGADGTIVCVAAGEAWRFGRDGAQVGRFAAPAGRIGPVCAEEGGRPVVSFLDGRRVVTVDAKGHVLWHTTLRDAVVSAAAAREGRSFVVVAGDGMSLLETMPPHAPSGVVAGAPRG